MNSISFQNYYPIITKQPHTCIQNDVIHFSPINHDLMINSSSGLILLRLVQETSETDDEDPRSLRVVVNMDEDMRLYQGIGWSGSSYYYILV